MKKNQNSYGVGLGLKYAYRAIYRVEMPSSSDAVKLESAARRIQPCYNFRRVKVSVREGSTRAIHLAAPQKIIHNTKFGRISAAVNASNAIGPTIRQGIKNSIEHQKPILLKKLDQFTYSMDSMNANLASLLAPVSDVDSAMDCHIFRNKELIQYFEGIQGEKLCSNTVLRNSSANSNCQVLLKKHSSTVKSVSHCTCPMANESHENWQKRLLKKHNGPEICWEHKGIHDNEFLKYWLENKAGFEGNSWDPHVLTLRENGWVACLKQEKFTVWRKPVKGSNMFMYRVQASFKDVLPRDMFQVQTDLELRKKWDEYITELKVLSSDRNSDQELVQWITNCPRPMQPREYIYKRRTKVDDDNKVMMVFNEATRDTANVPQTNIFRVNTYTSKLMLRSQHRDFEKEGVDFILTYHDDPESNVPSFLVSKIASHGISIMMERVHKLSKRLQNERN